MDEPSQVQHEIVDAARGYFVQFGYSRVSTDEIVRSIGRSKKTLYKHFETKEALLQAVLSRINGEIEDQLVHLFAENAKCGDGYIECLRDVLGKVAVHIASTSGVLFADLRTKSPDLYENSHGERQQALLGLLRRMVQKGIDAEYLRNDLDVDQVLTVFLASVESLANPVDVAANASQPTQLFKTLVTLTIDGLRRR
ncbi:MAG: TetR/AcrR family transcriptional regulator [Planctomycetota bacterium]|jgi:AcrR family transcriptional regulator|nr:TetR/AcrR family transcriptional regulator [Planctomycetota bacterium]